MIALLLVAVAWALPAPVRDAVEVRDCTAVHAALASPSTDEQRLAAGLCHLHLGDPARAVEVLAPLTGGVLGDYGRRLRGEALIEAGRHEQALAVLEGLALPGEAGLRVRLLRGRALVELERSLEARPDLRELLGTAVGVEARYWLAVGGRQRGATQPAIATFQRVWVDDPHGPWFERAAEALAALGAPVPDPDTEAGRALMRARADTLSEAERHGAARALVEAIRVEAPEEATGVALARSRFAAKDYPAATRAYAAALGDPAGASGGPGDLFHYALGTSRTGDYDTAAVIYRRLVEQHPATARGDEASYKLGYLEYDRRNCPEARARFAAHLERYPDSRHLDEALWFAARCAWKMGDVDDAEAAWKHLVRERPASSLVPGARYWQARAAGRRGDPAAERAGLAAVLERWPTTGYGWFAAEHLDRTFEGPGRVERPPWPEPWASHRAVQRAEALLAAGLPAWARAELEPVLPAVEGRDARLAAAHALHAAGDYRGGMALAEPWCGSADPVARQACTPLPEASIVRRVAEGYELHPWLPFAIMTAESALRPEVTSPAGARGLMQLMPEVAARVHAEVYGDQPFDDLRLYAGPYNASLGTAELGLKQRALGDLLQGPDLVAVIASYNAGEAPVRRWRAAWDEPPPFDEFAEDIGYTETRRYVRRVLGHLMTYRLLVGDP